MDWDIFHLLTNVHSVVFPLDGPTLFADVTMLDGLEREGVCVGLIFGMNAVRCLQQQLYYYFSLVSFFSLSFCGMMVYIEHSIHLELYYENETMRDNETGRMMSLSCQTGDENEKSLFNWVYGMWKKCHW